MQNSSPVIEETNIAMTLAIGRPRTVLNVGCGLGLKEPPPSPRVPRW